MEVIEIAKRIDGWKLQELLSDLAKKSRAGLATPELKWQIKEADQRLPLKIILRPKRNSRSRLTPH